MLGAVLLVLAGVLAPLSVASVWADSQLSDTERYVETVAPLADDPAVQDALADEVTAAVFENLDVEAFTTEALTTLAEQPNVPPRLGDLLPTLAVPIADGVEGFTHDQVDAFFASPQFAELWVEVNRVAHWLPVATLVLFVSGVLVARDRRRALLKGSLGVAASMVVLGVVLTLTRMWYVDTTPAGILTAQAAGGVFDTLVRFLRTSLRALAVVALVVALAAFLAGPSPTARRTRAAFERGIGTARGGAEHAGWDTGGFGTWVFAHRRARQVGILVAGGLVIMFWTRPTPWVVVWTAVAVVLALALVEFLAAPPAAPETVAPAPAEAAVVPRQRPPTEEPAEPAMTTRATHHTDESPAP